MEKRERSLEDHCRVAIVGAGPAASLLAASLLDGARLRRRRMDVALFDGGAQRGRSHTPLVINAPAMARLAAMGFPLPAAVCDPLGEVRAVLGSAQARAPFAGYAAGRGDGSDGDLPAYLRAGAVSRGARLIARAVDDITRVYDDTWALRSSGRTERFDLVVLACGAGSRVAAALPGHTPPPVLRSCSAMVPLDGDLRVQLGGRIVRIFGERDLPDLWLLPRAGLLQVVAIGADVDARGLADAVLAAVCNGGLPPLPAMGTVRRLLLAGGAARPALPTIGDALGAVPGELGLSRVASQANRFAVALLDGGEDRLLTVCKEEAVALRRDAAMRAALRRSWLRRSRRAAVAIARERSRPLSRRPVEQALAAQADPSAQASSSRMLARRLVVLWALFVAGLILLLSARRRRAVEPPPAGREVFVVEDDPDQSSALCDFLGSRGFAVRAFGDGLGAAAAAGVRRPAAIVLDVALPWMDGPAVCRAIRRSPATAGVPVVLVTGLPLALAAPEAVRSGADAVMVKPLDLEQLVRRLSAWTPPSAIPGSPLKRRVHGGEATDAHA